MNNSRSITAEEFAEQKYDLPEGGRWSELVAGEIVTLQPPNEIHGAAVLNISKALGQHLQESREGYACFELGLIVHRKPDTVRCPPVCCFTEGERFAEADKVVTQTKPSLVFEIASTNDRRKEMSQRVEEYLQWGVNLIWVADTAEQKVHVFRPQTPQKTLDDYQSLLGFPVLSGFRIRVSDIFAEPDWWQQ